MSYTPSGGTMPARTVPANSPEAIRYECNWLRRHVEIRDAEIERLGRVVQELSSDLELMRKYRRANY